MERKSHGKFAVPINRETRISEYTYLMYVGGESNWHMSQNSNANNILVLDHCNRKYLANSRWGMKECPRKKLEIAIWKNDEWQSMGVAEGQIKFT